MNLKERNQVYYNKLCQVKDILIAFVMPLTKYINKTLHTCTNIVVSNSPYSVGTRNRILDFTVGLVNVSIEYPLGFYEIPNDTNIWLNTTNNKNRRQNIVEPLHSDVLIGITLSVEMLCKRNFSFTDELILIKLHNCSIGPEDVYKGGWYLKKKLVFI